MSLVHRDRELYHTNEQKNERIWHLQYVRIKGNRNSGFKTPDIAIPTGAAGDLKINFGAKVSGSNNWYERPGNNTLTYVYTKYNGWRVGGKTGNENCYWKRYSIQNKQYLNQMLAYMGRTHKNACTEMKETFKRIESFLPDIEPKIRLDEFNAFRLNFTRRLSLFSVCKRLDDLVGQKTPSADSMKSVYEKICKDAPVLKTRISEAEFVELRSSLVDGDSDVLEKALGINRHDDMLDFEKGMLPDFEKFLDLQHKAYLQVARGRYEPSFRKLHIL